MFTKAELTIMQKYPLHVKVGRTQARIMEYYREFGGRVYVSFSGGMGSTVLLHIVRQLYPDTLAVFCDTKLEYPEIRQFVKTFPNVEFLRPKARFDEIIKTHGYPVVSKELARAIYYARRGSDWAIRKVVHGTYKDGTPCRRYERYVKYRYLMDAPFPIASACCEELKHKPFNHFETKSKLHPITGQMAEESFARQSAWMKNGCNAFNSRRPISNPLSFWTQQDLLTYITLTGIPYCCLYGDIQPVAGQLNLFGTPKLENTGCTRTGCFACMFGVQREPEPNRFQRMKLTHPKLYDYCIYDLKCGEVMDYMCVKY